MTSREKDDDCLQVERPSWLDLESIVPLKSHKKSEPDVEGITSISEDTIKREYPEYIVQLSPRRYGMKLRHALHITKSGKR